MTETVTAVIVAAGSSTRMGFDKLAYTWQGRSVLERSVQAFDRHPLVGELVLVAGPGNRERAEAIAAACRLPARVVEGGATRAESVRRGALAASGQLLAIHDAARPFVSEKVITAALEGAARCGAAAPAVPVKDTVKVARDGRVQSTPDRAALFAVQTPQCVDRARYLAALKTVDYAALTDDCQVMEQAGCPVLLTTGDYANYKITTPEDLPKEDTAMDMRVGHGYDVHKLVEGRRLILGGVDIPYEKGLLGHSDADVLAHAIMDALLGAAGLGDIGRHFPDSDPAYKGADSLKLASHVAALLAKEGWTVQNVDATILCQAPKLAPHIPTMMVNLAAALNLPEGRVHVKATTEEKLGFTGAGQGIAAHAVALLTR